MRTSDGLIKEYSKIPKEQLKKKDSDIFKWSKPFKLNEIVDFKGIKLKIIRIKKVKKEIHLKWVKQ